MADKDFIVKNSIVANSDFKANSTALYVGNLAGSYATVNSTIYTGTSANTLYVGVTPASAVVNSVNLAANLAALAGGGGGITTFTSNIEIRGTNLIVNTSSAIIANNSTGSAGDALLSNGTGVYWGATTISAPGGTSSNTFLIYNDSGSLNSANSFAFVKSSNTITFSRGTFNFANSGGTTITITANNGAIAATGKISGGTARTSSLGVEGYSESSAGVYGNSNTNYGIQGYSNSGVGVYGTSNTWVGTYGESTNAHGVMGKVTSACTAGYGVVGYGNNSVGVGATSNTNGGMYTETFANGSYYAIYAAALGANGAQGVGANANTGAAFVGISKSGYLLDLANGAGSSFTVLNNGSLVTSGNITGVVANASSLNVGTSGNLARIYSNATIQTNSSITVGTSTNVSINSTSVIFSDGSVQTTASLSGSAGTIYMSGSATAPSGYLSCNGSVYSKSSYSALATALGSIRSSVRQYRAPLNDGQAISFANGKIFVGGYGGKNGIDRRQSGTYSTNLMASPLLPPTDQTFGGTYVSSDSGATWTRISINRILGDVVYTGTVYMARDILTEVVLISTDGATWRDGFGTNSTNNLYDPTSYGGGVGPVWDGSRVVFAGADPYYSQEETPNIGTNPSTARYYANGTYQTYSTNGFTAGLTSSPYHYTAGTLFWDMATDGAGTIVMVGSVGNANFPQPNSTVAPRIYTSTDSGATNTSRTVPANFGNIGIICSVTYQNNRFIAMDALGNIAVSTNGGVTWTLVYTDTAGRFPNTSSRTKSRIVYIASDSCYYYGGYYSTDLTNWNAAPYKLGMITASNGTIICTGGNGPLPEQYGVTVYNPYPYTTSTEFIVPNITGTAGQYFYIKT